MNPVSTPITETTAPRTNHALPLVDCLNRPLRDARISVIDQCNFRCSYCMPKKRFPHRYAFAPESELLTVDEIGRLAGIFAGLGVRKIKITGGEPLLRPRLDTLVKKIKNHSAIRDIALTTNGVFLANQTVALKNAGLTRVTVSLNTLDARIFRAMTASRTPINQILRGIEHAQISGLTPVKVNAVVQKNINDRDIASLAKHFRGTGCVLRFIEYMDVGMQNTWRPGDVVSSRDIRDTITKHFPLEPVEPNYYGEVASRYRYCDGKGEVGFISSVTQPFCGTCTRLRLSADGKLYTCLFASEGVDLKPLLRTDTSDDTLRSVIANIWQNRDDRYSELRFSPEIASQYREKVEMYKVGG